MADAYDKLIFELSSPGSRWTGCCRAAGWRTSY